MSKATMKKHVLLDILKDDFSSPAENQQIVRVLFSSDINLHLVETANKSFLLVSMPTKFRKNIWVKRGDFVLVEPIEEGDKGKAKIVRILTNEHIEQFKNEKVWPQEFTDCEREILEEDDPFVDRKRYIVSEETFSDLDSSDSDSSDDKVCPQEFTDCEKQPLEGDDLFVNRNGPIFSEGCSRVLNSTDYYSSVHDSSDSGSSYSETSDSDSSIGKNA